MNILELKRKLLGHTPQEEGGGEGGGSAAGNAARNGGGFGGTGSGIGGDHSFGGGGSGGGGAVGTGDPNKPGETPVGGFGYANTNVKPGESAVGGEGEPHTPNISDFKDSSLTVNNVVDQWGNPVMTQAGADALGLANVHMTTQGDLAPNLRDGQFGERGDLSLADVRALNPNTVIGSQGQTAGEAIAAQNVSDALAFGAKVAQAAVPGLSTIKGLIGLYQGYKNGTISAESGLKDVAAIALGMKTGVSADALSKAFNGDAEGAVKTGVADKISGLINGAVASKIGQVTGIGTTAANAIGSASGIKGDVTQGVRGVFNGSGSSSSSSSSSSNGNARNASGEVRTSIQSAAKDINSNSDINNSIPALGRGF